MLAFLGLIPILLLLHRLRPRPKQAEITNLFLWEEVYRERSHRITLRELKRNIPLILQIVAVCLASIALADPVWIHFTQKEGDMILVLDTSASMKTRSGGKTRFQQAVVKAGEIIGKRRGDQNLLLIEAGKEPRLISGPVQDTGEARDLLDGLTPTDEPGDLKKALYFAISFMNPEKDDTVYLVTDGAGCDFPALMEIHPKIVPVLVRGGEKNAGITKFEFREKPNQPNHYEVMIEVKNFQPTPVRCPLRLTIDRKQIYETVLSLDVFEKRLIIIPYHGLITGIARASLETEDDFPTDNHAFLSLSASDEVWILLVSRGNYFLERVLESYPNIMVNSMKEIVPSSWEEQTGRHDIVIIDRMDFPPVPRGNFVLIDSYSPSIPIEKEAPVHNPGTLSWDGESPLMQDIDLNGLIIEEASGVKAHDPAKPVIESPETGLMYTYEEKGLRAVFLGFDINRSDLPVRVAFPVMMSHIINWLTPYKLSSSSLKTQAGSPIDIYVSPDTTTLSTRAPGGEWRKHRATQNPFRYTNTRNVGIYVLTQKNRHRYFTVNLVDELESDIQSPSIGSASGRPGKETDSEEVAVHTRLWIPLVLLLLLSLLWEYYFWLRSG